MGYIEKNDDEATVQFESDLLAVNARDFRDDLASLIKEGTRKITFDFTNVSEIDVISIGSLVAIHNQLKGCGGGMQLTNVNDQLVALFDVLRLNEHFAVISA